MAAAMPLQNAADLEQGKGGQGIVSRASEESFPKEYYVVYAFSLFVVAVGTWAVFFPFAKSHIVGTMCGVGGIVVGAFLLINADLLVTYVRLMREMQRFKANNKQFTGSLRQQKKKILQLKATKKALDGIEKHCNNKVENLHEEMDEMAINARDNVRRNIVNILTLRRGKQDIAAGEDLEQVLRMFTNMYIRAFPAIAERFAELRKGLEASERWRRVQKMSSDRFKFIVVPALFDDISSIKEIARQKVEEESDRAAEMDATTTEAREPGASQTGKSAAPAAAAAADDAEWADALDFAEGKKEGKAEDAPLAKADSWADAVSFAGHS